MSHRWLWLHSISNEESHKTIAGFIFALVVLYALRIRAVWMGFSMVPHFSRGASNSPPKKEWENIFPPIPGGIFTCIEPGLLDVNRQQQTSLNFKFSPEVQNLEIDYWRKQVNSLSLSP